MLRLRTLALNPRGSIVGYRFEKLEVSLKLARKRILNETTGYEYKPNRIARDLGRSVVWVVEGYTVRNMDAGEILEAMNRWAAQRVLSVEVLGRHEIEGLRFDRPKNTKYQQPWAAYEEMECPMGLRYCRWPRRERDFAMKVAA